ncbi:nuclear transport factor 2 family protein [Streptomyces megasporus]|uniref:nuclear transport factor 2 family protein n=1 Tax=Streptomyces megasporus TaxID=44060 RepID=UPI0004E149B1|nr:nuclear transport factor 2 family protein [Streptomyces megasporus]
MRQPTTRPDRAEVTDLVARLTRCLDDPSPDGRDLRAVYTEDAVVHSPRGTVRGIDAIVERVRRADPGDEHAQHFDTDVLVDLDGDRARVTANQLVYFFRPGKPPHRTAGLRHTLTAARTPAGWRIARNDITLLWEKAD